MKYEIPTPIQKNAIPLALAGRDLMCSAQTGSGKTCAFLLPMISSLAARHASHPRHPMCIDDRGVHPLAVVLAPTRELAAQIHLESKKLCFDSSLRSLVLYGGSEIRNQLSELSFGCDIIVATPGRLIDIIDRGIVSLSDVLCLILDEADRMLDMGFEPQIREIVQMRDMPPKEHRQTLMFSATFKPEIQSLASEFLMDYVWIGVGRVGSTVDNITQRIILSSSDPMVKLGLVLEAINATAGRTLVFVQKKRTAAWLSEALRCESNVRVVDIHSDKSQMQREASLKRFRDGNARVLVGTDVAARGLDIADVAHVIQFDLPLTPDEFDTFVHRMGRTGRAGHDGLATSLFVPGTEVGEGNGRVAPLILKLLEETGQDVPDWFRDVAKEAGKRGRGKANKFSSRDVRISTANFTPHTYNAAAPAYHPAGRGDAGGYGNGYGGGYPDPQQLHYGGRGGRGAGGRGGRGRFSGAGRGQFLGYGPNQQYQGYAPQQHYAQPQYGGYGMGRPQYEYESYDYDYGAAAAGQATYAPHVDPSGLVQGMHQTGVQPQHTQQLMQAPAAVPNGTDRSPRAMHMPRPPPITTGANRRYHHYQAYGQPSTHMGVYVGDGQAVRHMGYSMTGRGHGHAPPQASPMYADGSGMPSPFFVPPSPSDVSPRYGSSISPHNATSQPVPINQQTHTPNGSAQNGGASVAAKPPAHNGGATAASESTDTVKSAPATSSVSY